MPSSEYEEIEFLVPSIYYCGGGVFNSCIVAYGSVGGIYVDVDA